MQSLALTPRPLPAHGDLADMPFAQLLGTARALGATGVLCVRDDKEVFLSRGGPVAVRSDWAEESSEVYMIRAGVVSGADLAHVRGIASQRRSRFSEALLDLGVLQPS